MLNKQLKNTIKMRVKNDFKISLKWSYLFFVQGMDFGHHNWEKMYCIRSHRLALHHNSQIWRRLTRQYNLHFHNFQLVHLSFWRCRTFCKLIDHHFCQKLAFECRYHYSLGCYSRLFLFYSVQYTKSRQIEEVLAGQEHFVKHLIEAVGGFSHYEKFSAI